MKLATIPVLIVAAAGSAAAITAAAAERQTTTEQKAAKAPAQTVQPHSHLQEKTGIMPQNKAAKPGQAKQQEARPATEEEEEGRAAAPQPKSVATRSEKLRADKDKTRHYHPRDGK